MPNTVRDSRLTVPQLPPRHVSRPRLLAELDNAADLPLTLLSAGPGAGKTVLLTDWVRRGDSRVAWLNPTAADAEPLARHIADFSLDGLRGLQASRRRSAISR